MKTTTQPAIIEARLKDLHLEHGSHTRCEDGLCAMEAAAFIVGLEHTDHPETACPIINAVTIAFNDNVDDATRQKLIPLLPRIALSRSTPAVEQKRAFHFLDHIIRTTLPTVLDEFKESEWAAKFRALPKLNDETSCRRSRELVSSFADFLATPSTSPAPSSLLKQSALDLARALDLALDLARALARALDLALDLDLARARALVYNPLLQVIEGALEITE
jgi:hypothetical protein